MTLGTYAIIAFNGAMFLANLSLMVFAVVLLVKATMLASHPGSMDPNYGESKVKDSLQV